MRLEPPYDPTDGRDYIRRDTSSVSARMHFADGAGVELVIGAPRAWSPRRPHHLRAARRAIGPAQLRRVADRVRWARFPRVTELLESAGADLLGMLLAEQDDEQGGTALPSAPSRWPSSEPPRPTGK
jgi:hypothetical protein